MNYKSKYLKYKLKYLVAKKLHGGMEGDAGGDAGGEPKIPPAPIKFEMKHHRILIDTFRQLYIDDVPNFLKLYASNNEILELEKGLVKFDFYLDLHIDNLLSDVLKHWSDRFNYVKDKYPVIINNPDEHSKITSENLMRISMLYVRGLTTDAFNKDSQERQQHYLQANQYPNQTQHPTHAARKRRKPEELF